MRLRGDDQHHTWAAFLWAAFVFGLVFGTFTLITAT
jgi:hypothetical protein